MRPEGWHIPGLTDVSFDGTIKAVLRDAYFNEPMGAFITCQELERVIARDVYVPAPWVGSSKAWKAGDPVRFRVQVFGKKLRAVQVTPVPDGAAPGMKESASTPASLGRFRGTVTICGRSGESGFISCPELHGLTGREALFIGSGGAQRHDGAVAFEAVLHRRGLVQAVAPSASAVLGFGPSELAETAWSCAVLQFKDAPLLTAIAAASRPTISDATIQQLATTARAMSTLVF